MSVSSSPLIKYNKNISWAVQIICRIINAMRKHSMDKTTCPLNNVKKNT